MQMECNGYHMLLFTFFICGEFCCLRKTEVVFRFQIDSLEKKVCLVSQGIFMLWEYYGVISYNIKKVRPTQGRTYDIP